MNFERKAGLPFAVAIWLACVSSLLYCIHNDRVEVWVMSQFPKLEHDDPGIPLENELWSGEVAALHAKWSISLEHEKTSAEVTSNKFLPVEDNALSLECLVHDGYWSWWRTEFSHGKPDERKGHNESNQP